MSEPLKSCPFCGHAEPIVIQVCSASDFWWEVSCPGEECFTSKRGDTEPEAIAAWNRRAPPPAGEIKTLWVYDDQGNTTEMIPDPEGNVLATFDPEGVVYFTVGEPELGPEVEFTVKLSPREAWPPESHMNAEEGE